MNDRLAYITKVDVQGYRSLEDVVVNTGSITVLVGPNGSGKSSFADLFVFLQECILSSPEVAFSVRGGIQQVITRTGQRPDRIRLRVEICSCHQKKWRGSYSVAFKQLDTYPAQSEKGVSPTAQSFTIPQEECEIRIGEEGQVARFVVKDGKWEESTLGVTPALAANRLALPLLSGTEEFAPIYQALTEVTYYAPQPHPSTGLSHLFSNGTSIAAGLRQVQLKDQTRYLRIEETLKQMVPTIQAIQPKKIGRNWTVEFTEAFDHGPPVKFEAISMSEGTLRLLAILFTAYSLSPPTLIILEEPEVALHPGMGAILVDGLRESALHTQFLITTHSSDLITRFDVDSLRAVDRIHGVTTIAPIATTQRKAIQQRLFTAGELHRIEGLRPVINGAPERSVHA